MDKKPSLSPLYEEIDRNIVMEMQENTCYSNVKTLASNPAIGPV